MKEGGTCAHCGVPIGSYQFNPGQTTRNGNQYCSSWCAAEDNPILGGR